MKDRSKWLKASKSGPDSNCVEMCGPTDATVAVRDTKARGVGPELSMARVAAGAWIAAAKSGELDRLI
jgi:hypothetical protein